MKGSLPNIDNLSLSDQQKEVVIAALQGQSLFFTGAAGVYFSFIFENNFFLNVYKYRNW